MSHVLLSQPGPRFIQRPKIFSSHQNKNTPEWPVASLYSHSFLGSQSVSVGCGAEFCAGSASSSGWNPVGPLTCWSQDSTGGSYQSTLQKHRSQEQHGGQELSWIFDAALIERRLCFPFLFYMNYWLLQLSLTLTQPAAVKLQKGCVKVSEGDCLSSVLDVKIQVHP